MRREIRTREKGYISEDMVKKPVQPKVKIDTCEVTKEEADKFWDELFN